MRRSSERGLVLLLLLLTAAYAIAEEVTLTTYYPSPRGVYEQLRTSGDVHVGALDPPTARLHVVQPDAAPAVRVDDEAADPSPFIITDTGNVGIGTATPESQFQVEASPAAGANAPLIQPDSAQASMLTGGAQVAGRGAILGLGGTTDGTGTTKRIFGAIGGKKENSTSGSDLGYLAFYTGVEALGAMPERMRIASDGNVGIGTTTPTAGKLQFANVAPENKIVLWDTGPTTRYGLGLNTDNLNVFIPTTASFSLRHNSATGPEQFRVTGTGAVGMRSLSAFPQFWNFEPQLPAPTNRRLRLRLDYPGVGAAGETALQIDAFTGPAFLGFRTTLRGDVEVVADSSDVGNVRIHNGGVAFGPPGTGEFLKVVRGRIPPAGAPWEGSGFTVDKLGGGWYKIAFTSPFGDTPTVTATTHFPAGPETIAQVGAPAASSVEIRTAHRGTGLLVDDGFDFIAIGPTP